MKGSLDPREEPHRLSDSGFSDKTRLLGTGIISLLLHLGMVGLLSLSLEPAVKKGAASVYPVMLRPFFPLEIERPQPKPARDLHRPSSVPSNPLSKPELEKEKQESIPEIKRTEPVMNKNPEPEILASLQSPTTDTLIKPPKPLPQRREEEEPVGETLPSPVHVVAPLNVESGPKDPIPVFLPPSLPEEPSENTLFETGSVVTAGQGGPGAGGVGRGSGSGQGGTDLSGSGEGKRGGGGGSGQGVSGEGQGTGRGGFGRGGLGEGPPEGTGGAGKGVGSGQGAFDGSWGDGTGPGRGSPGREGTGRGGTGLAQPGYFENPKPIYPLEARKKGYQGEVVLRVEVLSNGRVGQIEVKKSSGYEMLDQSALTTVKKWRFIPAKRGDVAIPFWVNIPIKFQLR